MRQPFTLAMARRESRTSRRRLGLYMGAIGLGVGALVAINSFRANVSEAIHTESRNLLGADIEIRSNRPFPDPVQAVLDSAAATGTALSYVTNFASMALATGTGLTRLVEVRAIRGSYPYYGAIETEPARRWRSLQADRYALVDPALLVQLDAAVGDTVAIGETQFVISGMLTRLPGEVGFRAAFGPRVFIPARYLDETGLLRFGSRAGYRAFLKLGQQESVQRFLDRNNALFTRHQIRYDTAAEREEDLTEALDVLARFLGLVGLIALLLGGIGVASAVHVFVKDKLETVATLRCLGATQAIVFSVYLLQTAVMGLGGAAAGVALGVAVQMNLPRLLGDFLPLEVTPAVHWPSLASGLAVGMWVAVAFAVLPLLEVRTVSPLQALRRAYDGPGRPSALRHAVLVGLAASLLLVSVWQAPNWGTGLTFTAGVAVATGLLWITAWSLCRATRRFLPQRAAYVLRQGISNLHRPHNQTLAVILAVGFGVFLIGSVYIVHGNLLEPFAVDTGPNRPNLVVFDVQADQKEGVEQIILDRDLRVLERAPIVPARIAQLNGRSVTEILVDTAGPPQSRWPLRRVYRNTYRDTLVASEGIVAGRWWESGGAEGAEGAALRRSADPPIRRGGGGGAQARISIEEDLAQELRLGIGDHITWDIQGVQVETEIASLRQVEWARLAPNFFVVFEPGVLEDAPQTFVTLTRAEDPIARAELQRDLVRAYPNISALDLTVVQETIDTIMGSVSVAIRFMALFSIASGMIVLVGAVAASRFQRVRESVLLRTLGGRRRQISQILLTEYAALGGLGGLTGCLLAGVAGWALVRFFFELDFSLPALPLLGLWLGAATVTAVVGLLNSRDVLRRTPLAVLREMGE